MFLHIEDKKWERLKDLFTIISGLSMLVLAILGIVLTLNYNSWQKEQSSMIQTVAANTRIEDFNNLFIENEDLQQLELDLKISKHLDTKSDVVKMYAYFKWLNYAYNLYLASYSDSIEPQFLAERINTFSILTFRDREFIENNCFHRGYPDDFKEAMRTNWKKIELKE